MQEVDCFVTRYKSNLDANDMQQIRSFRDEFHSLKRSVKKKITHSFSEKNNIMHDVLG